MLWWCCQIMDNLKYVFCFMHKYQDWYNIYEGSKVSRVDMCEVSSKQKMIKNKPKKKKYNGEQWKEMDYDEPHLMLKEKT